MGLSHPPGVPETRKRPMSEVDRVKNESFLFVVLQGREGDFNEVQPVEQELKKVGPCFDPRQVHVEGEEILPVARKFGCRFPVDHGGVGLPWNLIMIAVARPEIFKYLI